MRDEMHSLVPVEIPDRLPRNVWRLNRALDAWLDARALRRSAPQTEAANVRVIPHTSESLRAFRSRMASRTEVEPGHRVYRFRRPKPQSSFPKHNGGPSNAAPKARVELSGEGESRERRGTPRPRLTQRIGSARKATASRTAQRRVGPPHNSRSGSAQPVLRADFQNLGEVIAASIGLR